MRQDEGFAGNMVRMAFALLQDVMQLFTLVGSAGNMEAMGVALSATAPQPLVHEDCVSSMAVAGKSARWKAAALLHTLVVYVASMKRLERASLMGALPTHNLDLNIVARNTAVEGRGSRALWRVASPPLFVRVSVPNMVVV